MEPFHADWFGQYKYDSFCMQSLQIYLTSTYYWWLLRPTIAIWFDSKFRIIAQLFDSIRLEIKKNANRTAFTDCVIITVVCTVCTALLFSYSAIFIAASVRNKLIRSSLIFIHLLFLLSYYIISCDISTGVLYHVLVVQWNIWAFKTL